MPSFFRSLVSVCAVPLVFVGCSTAKPDRAFRELDESLREHGNLRVRWMQDESIRQQIEQEVATLLQTKLTTASAVAIALLNNRTLQARLEEVGITQAELAQASRLHNPTLAASWRFPLAAGSGVNSDYGLVGNFLELLTLPARKKLAVHHLVLARQRLAHEILALAEEVQTTGYSLGARLQVVRRFGLIGEVNEAAADLAQRQFEAGNINTLELRTQQLAYSQARIDLRKAKAEVTALREKLNRLLGLAGRATDWDWGDDLPPLPDNEETAIELEEVALKRRFDLAVALGEVDSWAAALRLKQRTRYLPGVHLGVNAEQDLDHSWVSGPTLELEVPLFDQGQPELAKLNAEYRRARRRFEALSITIRSEVREAQAALLVAREAAHEYREALLPQNQQVLAETLLHYNAMQVSNYELLLAKEREQQAEQATIEALRDYWIARVHLQTVVGGSFVPPAAQASIDSKVPSNPAPTKPSPHSHP